MASFAEVVTQTFRSLTPEALSERLFGESLDAWWQNHQKNLEATVYKGPIQQAFFIATFAAMGRLCKADGRVGEKEINSAHAVMDHLGLDKAQRRIAAKLFNEGKQGDFDVEAVLSRFYRISSHRVSVLQVFIELQLQAAIADGPLNDIEEALLMRMCKRLDVSHSIYLRIKRRIIENRGAQAFPQPQPRQPMNLANAMQVLGVSRWVNKDELKNAYRRLLGKYHPDRMLSRGCTQEELDQANGKVQEVKQAYEIVGKARKLI